MASNTTDADTPRADSRREELIFGEPIDWSDRTGSTVHFGQDDGFGADVLRELIEGGYMNSYGHNGAPTPEEFLKFAEAAEAAGATIRFSGYVISPARDDCRVSVTGYSLTDAPLPVLQTAQSDHRFADDFYMDLETGEVDTWWD